MKKTLQINLAGFAFVIDEDAYAVLERYLEQLNLQFRQTEGGREIIQDIEWRIAELFQQYLESRQVVSLADVERVISVMGQPEDYAEADEEAQSQSKAQRESFDTQYTGQRSIFRDPDNRVLGGVASGLGHYFRIDAVWVRLIFIACLFAGFGFLLYIILWIVVPKAATTHDKLRMRGEHVNISNIQRSIRDEMGAVGDNFKNYAGKAGQVDYNAYSKRAGSFFGEFGRMIGMIFQFIFKLIGKIIGFGLLAFAIFLAVCLAGGLLTNGYHLFGNTYGIEGLYRILGMLTIDEFHQSSFAIGAILCAVPLILFFMYLGLRLMLNLNTLSSSVRTGLLLSWIAGVVIFVISGISLGLEFDSEAYRSESEQLSLESDSVYLSLLKDDIQAEFESLSNRTPFVTTQDGLAIRGIEFTVAKSDSTTYLTYEVESQGSSRMSALEHMEGLAPTYSLMGSELQVSEYYVLPFDRKIRAQRIDMVLHLPVGKRLFLDKSVRYLIYDIPNVKNIYDYYMLGHWWEMTEAGLVCLDCDGSEAQIYSDENEQEADPWEELEETEEAEAEESDLQSASLSYSTTGSQGLAHGISTSLQAGQRQVVEFVMRKSVHLIL